MERCWPQVNIYGLFLDVRLVRVIIGKISKKMGLFGLLP